MSFSAFEFEMLPPGEGGGRGLSAGRGGGGGGAGANGAHGAPWRFSFSTAAVASGKATVTHDVVVTNVGGVCSAVSVQGFVGSDHADAVTNDELFDFGVTPVLAPGERHALRLRLRADVLALVDGSGDRRIEPGEYRVRVGGAGSAPSRDRDIATAVVVLEDPPVFLWRLSDARRRWAVVSRGAA